MKVLVLNSGSSSQKSSLYDLREPLPTLPPAPLWQGEIEWSGKDAEIHIATAAGTSAKEKVTVSSREEATRQLLATLWTGATRVIASAKEITVVGHRVVNGGPDYRMPARINKAVKIAIEAAAIFAPLHNRAELDGISIIEKEVPLAPQVAVFDTGFHRDIPAPAYVYPGPFEWVAKGIRRYGFHGINHQYCAERAAQLLNRPSGGHRIVSCHLGNGCSLAAIRDGRSVDTTMGFTPLEGLMMGTRSGSLDPGILTYLLRQEKFTGKQIDDLLNKESGLLGISGFSGDMRDIVVAMKQSRGLGPSKADRAKLAFDIFVHRVRREMGGMIAVLGGLDVLVFTAGIGENSAEVRSAACETLDFAGVQLDTASNKKSPTDSDISLAGSPVRIFIIKAQEDWAIARECFRFTG